MQAIDVHPDINNFSLPNQEVGYTEGGYHPSSPLMALSDAAGDVMQTQLNKIYQNQLAAKNVQVTGDANQAAETAYRNIIQQSPDDPNNHAKLNQTMSDWWSNYKGGLTTDQVNFSSDYVNKLNLEKQSAIVNYGVQYSNSNLLAGLDKQQNDILKQAATAPPEMKQVYMHQLDALRSQAVAIGAMTPEQAAQHEIQGKSDYDINRAAALAINNPQAAMHLVSQSSDITPERKHTMIENLQHEERQRAFEAQRADQVGLEGYQIQAASDPSSIPQLLKQLQGDKQISDQGKARAAVQFNSVLIRNGGTDQQQQAFQTGMLQGTVDPNDKKEQLAANFYYNNLVKSNAPPEQLSAVAIKTGYIPETMQAQILSAQSSGDPKKIASAATMLSTISSSRPDALRFMNADPEARSFLMNVAHMTAGGADPAQAVKAAQDAQAAGVSDKDMQKIYVESQKFGASQATNMIGHEGNWFSRPELGADAVKTFMQTQLQSSYMEHRATGATVSAARDIAQTEVAPLVGISNVNGPNRLEILPPDKFSKETPDEIRSRVLQSFNQAGGSPVTEASIVADAQTLQEYKGKQAPTYSVYFKNPKSGAIVPAPFRFSADGRPLNGTPTQ